MGDSDNKTHLGRILAALRRGRFVDMLKSVAAQLAFFSVAIVGFGVCLSVLFASTPFPAHPMPVLGTTIAALAWTGFCALWLLKFAPHLAESELARARPFGPIGLGLLVVMVGAGAYAVMVV